MNWVDLIILVVILLYAVNGQRRGFFNQSIEILGFLFALIFALIFYPQSASLLIKVFNLPKIVASPVGFLIIWVIAESFFFTISSRLLSKFLKLLAATTLDKFFGFIPATINALLLLSFLLLFVVSLPLRPDIKRDIFASKIGSQLISGVSILETPLNSVFGPIAKQTLTFLTVDPKETGSIPLEFTQRELTIDSVSGRKMFELVNQERIKFGVKPLLWEEQLAEVARDHSRDMFERGYFSHYSPEGKDVGDRLIEADIFFNAAGENLALAPDVIRAHNGLMASPGHRRNILDASFSKIGIGAIDGGIYGKMFTQVFTD